MLGTAWGVPDSNGRWYLVDPTSTEVKVYDAAGRFLHRFGRPGQGPGEFDRIRHVFPMGDERVCRFT